MEVFDRISEQLEAVALPLFAVTLTALPRPDTPVLLMLHWHGFRPDPGHPRPPGVPAPRVPVPGSALQLNPAWRALERLDEAMLEAAWRLGAWELEREERRACSTVGAPDRETLECRQAFGEPTFGDTPAIVDEAPDRPDLLAAGVRLGYVRWQFRPVHHGLWGAGTEDETLTDDGGLGGRGASEMCALDSCNSPIMGLIFRNACDRSLNASKLLGASP